MKKTAPEDEESPKALTNNGQEGGRKEDSTLLEGDLNCQYGATTTEGTTLDTKLGVCETALGSFIYPRRLYTKMRQASNSAAIGWAYTLVFAILYSLCALVLGLRGFEPETEPLLPIDPSDYYLAQSGFTVPVAVIAMMLGFGVAYGLAHLCGSRVEDGSLWGAFSTAVVVPNFVVYWVPEILYSFIATPGSTLINDTFNLIRQVVLGPVWIVVYVGLAMHDCAGVSWWLAAVLSLLSSAVAAIPMMAMFR